MNINKTSEVGAYQRIRALGHDTQESTITLLRDMADIERQAARTRISTIMDQQQRYALQNVVAAITSYMRLGHNSLFIFWAISIDKLSNDLG